MSEKLQPVYGETLLFVHVSVQTKPMGGTESCNICLSDKSELQSDISVPLECNLNEGPQHRSNGFVIFTFMSYVVAALIICFYFHFSKIILIDEIK